MLSIKWSARAVQYTSWSDNDKIVLKYRDNNNNIRQSLSNGLKYSFVLHSCSILPLSNVQVAIIREI